MNTISQLVINMIIDPTTGNVLSLQVQGTLQDPNGFVKGLSYVKQPAQDLVAAIVNLASSIAIDQGTPPLSVQQQSANETIT